MAMSITEDIQLEEQNEGSYSEQPEDQPSPEMQRKMRRFYYVGMQRGSLPLHGFHGFSYPPGASECRIVSRIGEGTYGIVFKGFHFATGREVALKRLMLESDRCRFPDSLGAAATTLREICILQLQQLKHPNLLHLLAVSRKDPVDPTRVAQKQSANGMLPGCRPGENLWLTMELLCSNLYVKIRKNVEDIRKRVEREVLEKGDAYAKPLRGGIPIDKVRSLTFQLILAVHFIHSRHFVHRDLKPQNLLLDEKEEILKIADFGLARSFRSSAHSRTHEVVTLWYRSPELLLGSAEYTTPTDIWSIGCIVFEMITGCPLFPGDSEIDTLFKIFRLLGTPQSDPSDWPGVDQLPYWNNSFPIWDRDNKVKAVQGILRKSNVCEDAIDLVLKLLAVNPNERISARAALFHHPFLAEERTKFLNEYYSFKKFTQYAN